ncbi:YccS family putative transporter [Vibrio algarum]|uniref:YccS family putative transporter n=1 Tax=Vibrio algarum TaxID=3020714 RepID=UPI00389B089E
MQFLTNIRQLWVNPAINHGLLILITLLGVTIPCWYFELQETATPLILGVIAAALAESDDNFKGRIKAQVLTVLCFVIATFSIEILFDHPVLFAIGLFSSSIGFIMVGAIGPRYAKIAFGSLLIAIYTMLGAHSSTNLWLQPLLLLTGAIWYFFSSTVWYSIAPLRPVQQSLATVFEQLSYYFDAKKTLFHPISNLTPQPYRIHEAKLNVEIVVALNNFKQIILSRSNRGIVDGPSDRFLKIYFLAQDIHERISSSHYRYQDLGSTFIHSDIMFRFKHLIDLQARACSKIAFCINSGVVYEHGEDSNQALEEIQRSIKYLEDQNNTSWKPLLEQLNYLFSNLSTIEKLLSNISNPDAINRENDDILDDTDAHSLKEMWLRVRSNLNPSSLLFRHAIRLSIALTLGYGIIQMFDIERGYWILLTTLFVCQPNYSATRQKLVSRVIGTLIGLFVGVILLSLFPSMLSQLIIIVLSCVAFFVFRVNNYSYATAFITILVLFCFNQLGEGFAVIMPRLTDTLIGCLLAVGAVTYILPDWQSRRLHNVMAESISANKLYLAQIIGQYRLGKQNDLTYRIARRRAHNQTSLLSSAITNMLVEPGKHRSSVDDSFRFLTLNHALLSYISALGAHRQRISEQSTHLLILEAHREIHGLLEALYVQLHNDTQSQINEQIYSDIETKLSAWRQDEEGSARMVLQQLHLIYRMLPELQSLANKLAKRNRKDAVLT